MRKFFRNEDGATLVEYGVALIMAITVGGSALIALGNQTGTNMNSACEVLQADGAVSANC